jgi:GAF domain-containing protein
LILPQRHHPEIIGAVLVQKLETGALPRYRRRMADLPLVQELFKGRLEGRLVGVLAMFSRKALGQDTLEALEAIADTIAHNIERKRAEEKLARLNRTLQTLYRCNQALVCATEEYELLGSVCRILVDIGGLRMAWVGYRELDEGKTIRPVAPGRI